MLGDPEGGKWLQKPVCQKVNDTEVYKPGLYKVEATSLEATVETLNNQTEPWGVAHAST